MTDKAAALRAFISKYHVQFARETFTTGTPAADGTLVLSPDREGDPLPPIRCFVKVHGYQGQTWQTIVIDVDEEAGTYTVRLLKEEHEESDGGRP